MSRPTNPTNNMYKYDGCDYIYLVAAINDAIDPKKETSHVAKETPCSHEIVRARTGKFPPSSAGRIESQK